MVIGMAFNNCSRGQRIMALDAKGNKERAFATVGDVDLPSSMVDRAIDNQMQQSQLPPDILATLPPEYRIQTIAGGVSHAVQTAQIYEIARRNGYKPDDSEIKKTLHFTSEADFISNLLEQIKKTGQLKPDATQKDLEELAKPQLQGKTLHDVYTTQLGEIDKLLKDPAKRMELQLAGGQQYLMDKFSAGINPTDDEVKKGFETFEIKRIVIKSATPTADAAAKQRADKAYADLKAGKSFEDVMDSSTEEMSSDPKKKKSDNVLNLTQDMVEKLPDFKAILTLQPGAYSEPQKVTEGYAILKYVGKKVDIPKDYEAKKAQYKQQAISQQVQKKFKAEMDKIEKEVKPNFENKAYESAYRYQKATAMTPGPAQEAEFKAVFDLAKSVTAADEKPDVAAMVAVVTIQHLYDQPGADKNKLKADRIGALENYLTFNDSWAYRKEVIDSYKEKGDKAKAFDQILTAMDKNTKFDAQGQTTYSDISAKFLEIKTAGLVTADQEKQFRSKQEQWQNDKKNYDKQVEQEKKLKAEDDKKAAEEKKKADAEAKKKPSSGSTLAPPAKTTGKK